MKKSIKFFTAALIIGISGGLSSSILNKSFENNNNSSNSNIRKSPPIHFTSSPIDVSERPASFEVAAKMSVNAVVHVKTEVLVNRPIDPLYQFFYGESYQQMPQTTKSSGSGVLISDDGYIVTNNHVIDNAEKISITLNNKKTYEAEVIGADPNTDLALLKIDDSHLPYINYGNSNNIKVGEWVLAIGNPYNLTSTVTAGIVSAKGRDINILRNDPYSGISAIESFIQTDAAVNPGNSGGALVSTTGELIGINSAIQSNTGSYTGYSFAIPVNIVKKVVADLKEFGTVQRAFIGINISNIDDVIAEEVGIDDLNGVYVRGVTQNGSAQKAGIKKGDIIKKIGNKFVKDVPELQEQISQFRPGDKINITINRNNEELKFSVVLKNFDGNEDIVSNTSNLILKKLGAKFAEVEKNDLKTLKISNGVKVEEVYNGKLRSVGVRKGFIITKINHKKITSVNQLISSLEKVEGGILMEGIYENGKREFYGFGMK
jgi:Do/DeqQ family serine protease